MQQIFSDEFIKYLQGEYFADGRYSFTFTVIKSDGEISIAHFQIEKDGIEPYADHTVSFNPASFEAELEQVENWIIHNGIDLWQVDSRL